MFSAGPRVKIYIATEPLDMRKSFTGLAKAVVEKLGHDPQSGHLFAFLNRRRNLIKVLLWDENGYCLLCKRLDQGNFAVPDGEPGKNHSQIATRALATLIKARHVIVRGGRVSFDADGVRFTK